MFRSRVFSSNNVFLLERSARKGRRLQRKWLRWRIPLARSVALWDRPLFNAENRTPCRSIKNEQPCRLADESERGNRAPILADVDQSRCGRLVGIPEVVMNALKMPEVLSRVDVQGDNRIRVEIGARTIATPIVPRRRSESGVDDLALFVHSEVPTPVVDALPSLPPVIEPGRRMIGITRLRDGHKIPELVPCSDVERPRIPGPVTLRDLDIIDTQNNDVLIDQWNAIPRHSRINETGIPKRQFRLSRARIEGEQALSNHDENSRRMRRITGPIGHTARRGRATPTTRAPARRRRSGFRRSLRNCWDASSGTAACSASTTSTTPATTGRRRYRTITPDFLSSISIHSHNTRGSAGVQNA